MKLVNLVPLKEIDFRNQDAFDDYNKQHKLRPTTKVTIAGKVTTAGQAAQNSEPEKGTSVFGKDGGSSVFGKEKSKYDDKGYWKDAEYNDTRGYIDYDDEDSEEDDDYSEDAADVRLTSDRLDKVEKALEDDLDLKGNGFETTRESGGGQGGWEGPTQIFAKDKGDTGHSISIGSSNNDGTFSIIFLEPGGEEALFEPNWDALTGDIDLQPQQAYKVTKTLMKMPEVQKLLKGEITAKDFEPTYAKIKDKFSKSSGLKESRIKLKSLIKRNK
jgi:hypothetical protein